MKKLMQMMRMFGRKGPKLKYQAFKDQVHVFTDLKTQRAIAVFPQNSMHVQEMPYLYKQQQITGTLVCEWCTTHGIPYQIFSKYWTKRIIAQIRRNNMRPES